jgi:hypothetical protein
MRKFKKFTAKLRAEGYSQTSARKIAAVEGAKAHGWKWMERRSAEARANEH